MFNENVPNLIRLNSQVFHQINNIKIYIAFKHKY